ncbi:uncharacterized protein LOC122694217 isoform X2 [Cervus elaphus]|uniref:uncharacterized protein LOC122694217 isoform X2 n=1 Tax=Cervus elaphus TaxID=9860 RepID=UPI001CC30EB6|nr:uncharacterized protein LOC122694217 isoform X2 [Cervus elaphus]
MTAHHFPVWEKRPASPSETNRKTQGPKAPRALTHSVPGGGHPGLCAFRVQFGKAGAGHRGRAESEQVGRQGRGRGQRKKPCLDTHEALAEVAPSSYTMPAGTVQGARCTEANQEVGLCARGAGGSSSWRTPNSLQLASEREPWVSSRRIRTGSSQTGSPGACLPWSGRRPSRQSLCVHDVRNIRQRIDKAAT